MPQLVRGFQCLGDLPGDRQGFGRRQRPARHLNRQVLAGHQLHDQRADAAGFLDAVDGGDVRVVQRGQRLRFAREAREAIGIGGQGCGQDLDGDVAIELGIARAIDLAHPAGAQWR